MITFYKRTDNGITTLPKQVAGCWIRCVDPTAEEMEQLTKLGIPLDFITYSLDQDERPRIEREDDGTRLIILRIPIEFEANADIPFDTTVLLVFLPRCIIFVPVSACCILFVTATE